MITSNVSEDEIKVAFAGTNFGVTNHRKLLATSVLKKALGYHCGSTISKIMEVMELVTVKGKLTEKGRVFCYNEHACDTGG